MSFTYLVSSYLKDQDSAPVEDEKKLENPDLIKIREVFNLPKDYQFTDMYEISQGKEQYFIDQFNLEFDFLKYQYFFEVEL